MDCHATLLTPLLNDEGKADKHDDESEAQSRDPMPLYIWSAPGSYRLKVKPTLPAQTPAGIVQASRLGHDHVEQPTYSNDLHGNENPMHPFLLFKKLIARRVRCPPPHTHLDGKAKCNETTENCVAASTTTYPEWRCKVIQNEGSEHGAHNHESGTSDIPELAEIEEIDPGRPERSHQLLSRLWEAKPIAIVLFYGLILQGCKEGIRNAIVPAAPSLTSEVNEKYPLEGILF
jgi:hypothetical protein